jgi:ribosomal-protein-alanine N-acetyltransferase
MTTSSAQFRPLTRCDVQAMVAIENEVANSPWSSGLMKDAIAMGHNQVWGAFMGDTLLGFAVISKVMDEAELLSIAVAEQYQRQGWGEKLLNMLIEQLQFQKVESFFLEVRASNIQAQKFYKKCGFTKIYERTDYYPGLGGGPREAAFVLQRILK